jgi:hypothetical protein
LEECANAITGTVASRDAGISNFPSRKIADLMTGFDPLRLLAPQAILPP